LDGHDTEGDSCYRSAVDGRRRAFTLNVANLAQNLRCKHDIHARHSCHLAENQ
jgi:hypothetical protein